jgi:signal transduction histidine kinase
MTTISGELVIALTAQARAARARWAAPGRWSLARRFLLPALICWPMVTTAETQPWLAVQAVVVAVALLTRFVWPAAALLLVSVLPGTWLGVVLAVPVIACAAGRRIRSAKRAIAVFTAAAALLAINVLLQTADDNSLPVQGAAVLAGTGVVAGLLLPGMVGAWASERARRLDALRERNALLERANELGETQAKMRERARIAGEMHDLLGHRLSLISLHAGALELSTRQRTPDLSEQALLVRTTAKTAMDELRQVLGVLRVDGRGPHTDESSDNTGTRDDVTELVELSRCTGLPVELEWDGPDLVDVDGQVRRAVHRVVREGLTNVHKHAPNAITSVQVANGKQAVRVEVRNELGPAPSRPVPGTKLGLAGLRERVRLLGGTVTAGADEHRRLFVVAASIPFPPARGGNEPEEVA